MGLQIWKFTRGRGNVEKKVVLALEKMGRDLRSTIRIPDSDTKSHGFGNRAEIHIPSIIRIRSAHEDTAQYGLIVYRWESSHKTLCRQELTATDFYRHNQPPCVEVAGSIRDFQMKYLIYEGVGEAYSWLDSWDEKDMAPLAVEIRLEIEPVLKGEKDSFLRSYHKIIFIPAGEKILEIKTKEEESQEAVPPVPETPAKAGAS